MGHGPGFLRPLRDQIQPENGIRPGPPVRHHVLEPVRHLRGRPDQALDTFGQRGTWWAFDMDSGYLRFRAEFIRQLPQERILRRSSKPWFLKELGDTALRIEEAIAAALACESSKSSGDPAGELDLPKCKVASTYLKYGDSA